MTPIDILITSINLGRLKTIEAGDRITKTGIFKEPATGPVEITAQGVAGDVIADKEHHGGFDQAVYLYSSGDADWWAHKLQRDVPPGFFGENLTLSRWWPNVRIGDRLEAGPLRLEITFPRIPCSKLAARVGDLGFVKSFAAARKPGAYARVLTPGSIRAGQAIVITPAPDAFPTVEAMFDLWYAKPRDHELMRQALAAPLAQRAGAAVQRWLQEDQESQ